MEETRFIKFAQEILQRPITRADVIIAKRNPNERNNADIVEINDLLSVWKDMPLRGKIYFINEAQILTERNKIEYLNTPIPSYSEYKKKFQDNLIQVNKEIEEEKELNGDYEPYIEDPISMDEYNSLSFDEYASLLNFKKPRAIGPYGYFSKVWRQYVKNEDALISGQRRTFASMGEKLGMMWAGLPDKGTLDY